jgi:methyl-accepting chemotaxis protein
MAASGKVSWYSTIRIKLITVIILTTTLVLGVTGYFAYKYTESGKIAELNDLANVTADRLSVHLVIPMWDLDDVQVNELLEAEMREQKVSGVIVRDEDDTSLFAAKERDSSGAVIDSIGAVTGDLISQTRNIVNDEKKIGTVSVFITRTFLERELSQFAQGVLIVIIGLNFIMLIIMALALGQLLISPLKQLASVAEKISRGDLNQTIDIHSNDEIGSLANAFGKMQTSLRIVIRRMSKTTQKGGA